MKYNPLYILLIVIAIIGAAYIVYHPSLLSQQSIVSVSQINYGSVEDGKLIGAKYLIHDTITTLEDTILVTTKEDGLNSLLTVGSYKILPKKNIKIKMKSDNPHAVSSVSNLPLFYYQGDTFNSLKGSSWDYYTPYSVSVYADESTNPETLISSKTIDQISNSQTTDISSGITAMQTSIAFIGPSGLPSASNIIVLLPSSFPDVTDKFEYSNEAKTVDYLSLNAELTYFNNKYDGSDGKQLNNPLMTLWTGYDEYSFWGISTCSAIEQDRGYCKIPDWDGLVKEVDPPSYSLPVLYDNNQILINNIQYGSNVNLEIPSEIVESLAILIGVGDPKIKSSTVPEDMIEGTSYTATIEVQNNGDTDGFTIKPISTNSRIIFSPSIVQETLGSGLTKTFSFSIIMSGAATPTNNEDIKWEVSAQHDGLVSKIDTVDLIYVIVTPTPTITPTPIPTPVPGSHIINRVFWYDTFWLYIGILFILVGILMYRYGDDI